MSPLSYPRDAPSELRHIVFHPCRDSAPVRQMPCCVLKKETPLASHNCDVHAAYRAVLDRGQGMRGQTTWRCQSVLPHALRGGVPPPFDPPLRGTSLPLRAGALHPSTRAHLPVARPAPPVPSRDRQRQAGSLALEPAPGGMFSPPDHPRTNRAPVGCRQGAWPWCRIRAFRRPNDHEQPFRLHATSAARRWSRIGGQR